MKIQPQHFQQLKNALAVISPTVKTRYRKEGKSTQRFVWDCFWHVCYQCLFDPAQLYEYMNDSHIETALRKVLVKS